MVRQRQERKQHLSKNNHLPVRPPIGESKLKINIKTEPPPSLKFLRNPQWVSSRLHKDRPSPLPLFKNQSYPSIPSTADSPPSENEKGSCESNNMGWSYLGSESELESDYSPFPLSPSSRNSDRDKDVERNGDGGERDPLLILEEGRVPAHADMSEKVDSPTSTSTSTPAIDTSGKIQPRWCKRCDAWKPDRTHHCRHCHLCVLKSK